MGNGVASFFTEGIDVGLDNWILCYNSPMDIECLGNNSDNRIMFFYIPYDRRDDNAVHSTIDFASNTIQKRESR